MILTKEQCLSEELNPQSSAIDFGNPHLRDAIYYAMNLWGEQCFNAGRMKEESVFGKYPEMPDYRYRTFELFLQSINQK